MEHYEFEARLPIDHVRHIVASVREGVPSKSGLLMCVGSATGELGALLATFENPDVFSTTAVESMSEEEVLEELESLLNEAEDSTYQLSPFAIALIMKAIELALEYLKNR